MESIDNLLGILHSQRGRELITLRERRRFLGLGEEIESYGWVSDTKLRETACCVREQAEEARELGAHHVEIVVTAAVSR